MQYIRYCSDLSFMVNLRYKTFTVAVYVDRRVLPGDWTVAVDIHYNFSVADYLVDIHYYE